MTIFSMITLGLTGLMLTLVGAMRVFKPAGSYCLQTYAEVPGVEVATDARPTAVLAGTATFVAVVDVPRG